MQNKTTRAAVDKKLLIIPEEIITINKYALFLKNYKKAVIQLDKLEKILYQAAMDRSLIDSAGNLIQYIDNQPFKHNKLLNVNSM